jgi:hypothetical protein
MEEVAKNKNQCKLLYCPLTTHKKVKILATILSVPIYKVLEDLINKELHENYPELYKNLVASCDGEDSK